MSLLIPPLVGAMAYYTLYNPDASESEKRVFLSRAMKRYATPNGVSPKRTKVQKQHAGDLSMLATPSRIDDDYQRHLDLMARSVRKEARAFSSGTVVSDNDNYSTRRFVNRPQTILGVSSAPPIMGPRPANASATQSQAKQTAPLERQYALNTRRGSYSQDPAAPSSGRNVFGNSAVPDRSMKSKSIVMTYQSQPQVNVSNANSDKSQAYMRSLASASQDDVIPLRNANVNNNVASRANANVQVNNVRNALGNTNIANVANAANAVNAVNAVNANANAKANANTSRQQSVSNANVIIQDAQQKASQILENAKREASEKVKEAETRIMEMQASADAEAARQFNNAKKQYNVLMKKTGPNSNEVNAMKSIQGNAQNVISNIQKNASVNINAVLTRAYDEARSIVEAAKQEAEGVKQQARANAERELANSKVSKTTTSNTSNTSNTSRVEEEVKRQLEETRQELEQVRKELTEVRGKSNTVNSMSTKLVTKEQELQDALAKNNKLMEQLTTLSNAKNRLDLKEKELQNARRNSNTAAEQQKELSKEQSALRNSSRVMEQKLDEREKHILTLQEELTKQAEDLEKLQKKVGNSNSVISKLQEKELQLQQKEEAFDRKVGELNEALSQIQVLQGQTEAVQEQLMKAHDELSSMQKKEHDLLSSKAKMTEQARNLANSNTADAQKKLNVLLESIKQVKRDEEEVKSRIQQKMAEENTLKDKVELLTASFKQLDTLEQMRLGKLPETKPLPMSIVNDKNEIAMVQEDHDRHLQEAKKMLLDVLAATGARNGSTDVTESKPDNTKWGNDLSLAVAKTENDSPELMQKVYMKLKEIEMYIDKANNRIANAPSNSDANRPKLTNAFLVREYARIIGKMIQSPVVFKLLSLDVQELAQLWTDTNMQIFKGNGEIRDKHVALNELFRFLYLDITSFLKLREHVEFATVYKTYFAKAIPQIELDTIKAELLFQVVNPTESVKDSYFIFIKRFADTLASFAIAENQSAVINFYRRIVEYLVINVDNIQTFASELYSDIISSENVLLHNSINMLLQKRANNNVLTYVKVRNDDGNNYNQRFKVFVNNGQGDQSTLQNSTLIVKYNPHNLPYYEDKGSVRVASSTLQRDWDKLYNKLAFDKYFTKVNDAMEVNKYNEEYFLGPFTRVFEQRYNNKEIAEMMDEVVHALQRESDPKPVFLIGYGASGAGKTSTLVYFNKGGDNEDARNGVLMHLCIRMAREAGYNHIRVKSTEFFAKQKKVNGGTGTYQVEDIARTSPAKGGYINFEYIGDNRGGSFQLKEKYTHYNGFKSRAKEVNSASNGNGDTTEFEAGSALGKVLIHMIDTDRFVKATTNNPNSSRSHTMIFITFGKKEANSGNTPQFESKRTLIVGDFAGVENAFGCDRDDVLGAFLNINRDDGSGNKFYSSDNASLRGEEGGVVLKGGKHIQHKRSRLQKGGDECASHRTSQADMFILGKTKRTKRTNNSPQLELDMQSLYEDSIVYNNIVRFYLQCILAEEGKPQDNPMMQFLAYNNITTVKELFEKYKDKVTRAHERKIRNTNKIVNVLADSGMPLSEIIDENDEIDVTVKDTNNTDMKGFMSHLKFGIEIKGLRDLKDKDNCPGVQYVVSMNDKNYVDLAKYSPESGARKWLRQSIINTHADERINNIMSSLKLYKELIRYLVSKDRSNELNNNIQLFSLKCKDKTQNNLEQRSFKFSDVEDGLSKFLQHPLLGMFGIDALPFKTLSLTDHRRMVLEKPKLVAQIRRLTDDRLKDVLNATYDEVKELVLQTMCKLQHGKRVCDVRLAEGNYINKSLKDTRDVIQNIMYEKNKNSVNISPNFLEPCLPSYCFKGTCFGMNRSTSARSSIFSAIAAELSPGQSSPVEETLKDLIVGVFCVLNMSRRANNPPPVPYINTNDLKYELRNTDRFTTEVLAEMRLLDARLDQYMQDDSPVKLNLDRMLHTSFKDVLKGEDDKGNRIDYVKTRIQQKFDDLLKFIIYLDNVSAASAVGTLQFVDSISKYNTSQIICSQQKIQDNAYYRQLVKLLAMRNIVDGTEFDVRDKPLSITSLQKPEPVNIPVVNSSRNANANTASTVRNTNPTIIIPPGISRASSSSSKPKPYQGKFPPRKKPPEAP